MYKLVAEHRDIPFTIENGFVKAKLLDGSYWRCWDNNIFDTLTRLLAIEPWQKYKLDVIQRFGTDKALELKPDDRVITLEEIKGVATIQKGVTGKVIRCSIPSLNAYIVDFESHGISICERIVKYESIGKIFAPELNRIVTVLTGKYQGSVGKAIDVSETKVTVDFGTFRETFAHHEVK